MWRSVGCFLIVESVDTLKGDVIWCFVLRAEVEGPRLVTCEKTLTRRINKASSCNSSSDGKVISELVRSLLCVLFTCRERRVISQFIR